jgi:hypothetical protein
LFGLLKALFPDSMAFTAAEDLCAKAIEALAAHKKQGEEAP